MTLPHYINGRVLLRPPGGVRRYAREVADRMTTATILQPGSAARPWSARIWEQTTLHREAADGVLLNMAHSGPLRHRRHVLLVHDLFALTNPGSVHPAFALLHKAVLPRLIASASQVVTPSAAVADKVAEVFDIAAGSIEVVPPGISDVFQPGPRAKARTQLGLAPDRPVIAALLDPTPRKNSSAVASVLHELRAERDVEIVVAGQTEAASFGRRADANHVSRDGFHDLGVASDSELATMYQAADVFVALSSGEGFGIPVVEAALCGAAVVTTPVPSIDEFCANGAVTVTNAREATVEIRALLDEPQRRNALSNNAAEQLGDLRWGATAATLENIMVGVR